MSPTTRATPPTPGTPPTRGPSRRLKTSSGRRRPPGAWSTARPATAVANRSALPAGTPRSTPSCSSPPGWPAASAFGHDRSDLVGGRVGRSRRADALPGDPAPPRLGCGGASAPGQAAGRGAVVGLAVARPAPPVPRPALVRGHHRIRSSLPHPARRGRAAGSPRVGLLHRGNLAGPGRRRDAGQQAAAGDQRAPLPGHRPPLPLPLLAPIRPGAVDVVWAYDRRQA